MCKTIKKRVTVIDVGSDKAVDKCRNRIEVGKGRGRWMFCRGRYADQVRLLRWDWNDRVLSRMTSSSKLEERGRLSNVPVQRMWIWCLQG